MKSRVLLICPEPLSEAKPAGVGIRFIEFARQILKDGHSVTVLSADGGSVDGCKRQQTGECGRDDSDSLHSDVCRCVSRNCE